MGENRRDVAAWTKAPSLGWMFVPLTQYHGGGTAATIEPLEGDDFVSMALLANDLYLGTRKGSLYALRELQEPAR